LITTTYFSRTELRGSITEIDATLKTDADNDRRTYADITVGVPGRLRNSKQAIRFTHFREGNAGG